MLPCPYCCAAVHLSVVSLQLCFVVATTMLSLCLYASFVAQGISIRADGRFKNIETWLQAFEQMPCYIATKSDYYTHVMDIPPQYGPGFGVKEAAEVGLPWPMATP